MKKTVKAKAKKTVTKKKTKASKVFTKPVEKYGHEELKDIKNVEDFKFFTKEESLDLANSIRAKNKRFVIVTPIDNESTAIHTHLSGKDLVNAYIHLKEYLSERGILETAERHYETRNGFDKFLKDVFKIAKANGAQEQKAN